MTSNLVVPPSADDALCRYGAPTLVQEYEKYRQAEQKEALLAAFMTTQRDNLMQIAALSEIRSKKSKPRNIGGGSQAQADQNCPLARALLDLGVDRSIVRDEHVMNLCRRSASTWGTVPISLSSYKQTAQRLKQEASYATNQTKGGYQFMYTDKNIAKTGQKSPDWSKLRKVSTSKLKLFQSAVGFYIEGTIVGEAIQPMVGGTVLLQEASFNGHNSYVAVAFYNVLPAGLCGADAEPLLRAKFPLGATLKVAEPFFKIFRDGSRGIRVDDPSDLLVVDKMHSANSTTTTGSTSFLSDADLLKAKNKGNRFVAKKQFDAAVDVYLTALRCTPDLIPTVLSNRAQAYIFLEQWAPAFCDAAASLTIRPACKKTWARYTLTKTNLLATIAASRGKAKRPLSTNTSSDNSLHCTRDLLAKVIDSILPPSPECACEIADSARGNDLKLAGNHAFKKKDYVNAIVLYSKSLRAAGGTNRALLSNWSHCALEIGSLMDALASATASLRIAADEKAIFRLAHALALLGEYDLAIQVTNLPIPMSDRLYTLRDDSMAMKSLLEKESFRDSRCLTSSDPPTLLAHWIGPVETYVTESKGRGLRATRDIKSGEIILVERPMASVSCSVTDVPMLISFFGGNKVDMCTPTTILKAALVHRTQRDRVLSDILARLSDGDKSNPLVPLEDVALHLDVCPLLLPGHYEYMEDERGPQLSAERLEKIVYVNCHGFDPDPKVTETTQLLPAISMMNHSKKANATFLSLGKKAASTAVIVSSRPIRMGEEVCMRYLEDEAQVAEKWGKMY
jgi:tetratricopeptide (TPR) repeat protein